jgi:arylsulfatase A-like enzyme
MYRSNLILITIDSLRADHVEFLGYSRPTTPCLGQLAAEGMVLENTIVAGFPTYHSFPTIMAGRYPLAMGRDTVGLAPGEPTLASILQNAGYVTAAFVAGNPYVSRWSGYHLGFNTFDDFLNSPGSASSSSEHLSTLSQKARRLLHHGLRNLVCRFPGGRTLYNELYFWWGVRVKSKPYRNGNWEAWRRFPSATALTDHALTWLENETRRPFFLWLHFMDAHRPYLPSTEALHAIKREDLTPQRCFELYNLWIRADISNKRRVRYREDSIALYDASIRWIDEQIGRLLEALKKKNLWN